MGVGVPDRGWSWVVVGSAWFASLVLAGIFRTSGVLFVAFIRDFRVTREEAAWPAVVCIAVLNLVGPFSGVLGRWYGVRPVAVAGSVVGAVGLSSCFFTNSLPIITLLFGGIFGIGYGLVATLMPVIVNAYFVELRSTANGLAHSGSCLGSVLLPHLFEGLIDEYGLPGCFLLTGGIVLNLAVAAALLRPPPWLNKNRIVIVPDHPTLYSNISRHETQRTLQAELTCELRRRSNQQTDSPSAACMELIPHRSSGKGCTEHECHNVDCSPKRLPEATRLLSVEDNFEKGIEDDITLTNSYLTNSEESCGLTGDVRNSNPRENPLQRSQKEDDNPSCDFRCPVIDVLDTSRSEEVLNRFSNGVKTSQLTDSCPARHSFSVSNPKKSSNRPKSPIPGSRPLKKTPYVYPNSSGDIHASNLCPRGDFSSYHNVSQTIPEDQATSNDSPFENKEKDENRTNRSKRDPHKHYCSDFEDETVSNVLEIRGKHNDYLSDVGDNLHQDAAVRNMYKSTTNSQDPRSLSTLQSFSAVLSSPLFYVTAATNVSFYFLFHMYVVVVVDVAMDVGVPPAHAKHVLSAFSAADLVGRLCLGWVTDRRFLSRARFIQLCMATIGLVFFAFPLATNLAWLAAVSCAYGILLGATVVVFPIVLLDYLGEDLYPIAYGCMCFANGFASFTRPHIIGYFRDNVGSYSNMFYVLGVISLVASSVWFFDLLVHEKKPSSGHCRNGMIQKT